jgi:hypothetical protein
MHVLEELVLPSDVDETSAGPRASIPSTCEIQGLTVRGCICSENTTNRRLYFASGVVDVLANLKPSLHMRVLRVYEVSNSC